MAVPYVPDGGPVQPAQASTRLAPVWSIAPPIVDQQVVPDQSMLTWQYAQGEYQPIYYTDIIESASPKETGMWQKMLEEGGYLAGQYVNRQWDGQSREALLEAIYDASKDKQGVLSFLANKTLTGPAGLPGGSGSAAPYTGPTTTTSTNTSTQLSSKPTARSVLTQALITELGREPTRAQVDAFLKGLNVAEKKHPTTSTTVTTSDPDPKSHTNTVTSDTTTKQSKVDPTDRAERFAENVDPKEAHRYQTGNYYNVIANMLGV